MNERSGGKGVRQRAASQRRVVALAALRNLAESAENHERFGDAGTIAFFVDCLRTGTELELTYTAGAMWHLASWPENHVAIAQAGGIEALVALARDGDELQKESAAGALMKLAENKDNQVLIAEAGGIPVLMACADNCDEDVAFDVGEQAAEPAGLHDDLFGSSSSAGDSPKEMTQRSAIAAGTTCELAALRENPDSLQTPATQQSTSARETPELRAALVTRFEKARSSAVDDGNRVHGSASIPQASADSSITADASLEQPRTDGNALSSVLLGVPSETNTTTAASSLNPLMHNTELERSSEGVEASVSRLNTGNPETKAAEARLLRSRCAHSESERQQVVAAGAIPSLLRMLGDTGSVLEAALLIDVIANHGEDARAEIIQANGVRTLATLVHKGQSDEVRESAIRTLKSLLASPATREAKGATVAAIIDLAGGIGGDLELQGLAIATFAVTGRIAMLTEIVRAGIGDSVTPSLRALTRVIVALCKYPSKEKRAATMLLVKLLQRVSDEQKAQVVPALQQLSSLPQYRNIIFNADGVTVLTRLLAGGPEAQTIGVLITLANLAIIEVSFSGGDLVPRVLELVRSDNEMIKTRALTLLRLLARSPRVTAEIVRCGEIALMLAVVREGSNYQKEDALGILARVEPGIVGTEAMITSENIHLLVDIDSNGNKTQRAYASSILMSFERDQAMKQRVRSIRSIYKFVQMGQASNSMKALEVAQKLRKLAVDKVGQADIILAGGARLIVNMLASDSVDVKVEAASALFNLSTTTSGRLAISKTGGIPRLLNLLQHGQAVEVWSGIRLIRRFARHSFKKAIAKAGGVPILLNLLQRITGILQQGAVDAILGLSMDHQIKLLIVSEGGVRPLIEILRNGSDHNLKASAAQIIQIIWTQARNRRAIMDAGVFRELSTLLQSDDDTLKGIAVSTISNLAVNRETQIAAAAAGCGVPLRKIAMEGPDGLRALAANTLHKILGIAAATSATNESSSERDPKRQKIG